MSLRDFDIIEDVKPLGGGWRYMQPMPDGTLHRVPTQGAAGSGHELVEMVRKFRVNMAIDPGDYERDVADYIRQVSLPNDRFRGKGAGYQKPRRDGHTPLIQRLRAWVDDMAPRKPRLMTPGEATERAQICIGCPQNVRWKTQCGDCNDAVEYTGHTMRGTCNFPLDDALHACRLHNLHLPSAVFLDRDHLPAKIAEAPAQCWLPNAANPA